MSHSLYILLVNVVIVALTVGGVTLLLSPIWLFLVRPKMPRIVRLIGVWIVLVPVAVALTPYLYYVAPVQYTRYGALFSLPRSNALAEVHAKRQGPPQTPEVAAGIAEEIEDEKISLAWRWAFVSGAGGLLLSTYLWRRWSDV